MTGLVRRLLARRAERRLHNDYDSACIHWYGDRAPNRERKGPFVWSGYRDVPITLRNMDGSPTMVHENRCGVCNPYSELEAEALVDFELHGTTPEGHWWLGSILVAGPPPVEVERHR